MKRKKLVFDMDGTLLDSMAMWNNFLDLYKDFDMSFINIEAVPELEKTSSLSYSVQLVKDYLNEVLSDEEIAMKVHAVLFDFYSSKNRAKSNVEKTLLELYEEGYEIYLATATDYIYAREGIRMAEVLPYFKKLYTPDTIGFKKHLPAYYDFIISDIGAEPEDCIFFDDASYAIELAKNSGYYTVGMYDPHSSEMDKVESVSDYFVKDFAEIKDLLGKIK